MKYLLLFLLVSCSVQQPYKIHHGWTSTQWQEIIDCTNKPGNGGDWSCDSCYIVTAKKYNIEVDTNLLNYY
jgi:hypothetical protein